MNTHNNSNTQPYKDVELRNDAIFAYYDRLSRVKAYVESHLENEITLQKAARIACLEEKYFSRYFKEKVGICFSHWLANKRVKSAIQIMKTRNSNITNVAFAVGFRDLRTFERAFKRYTDMTPREFKMLARPRHLTK